MRAIDTNVLVRLIARDDPRQVKVADAFVSGGAWVSHLVLVESVWVLDSVYELSTTEIVVAIEMLLNHTSIVVQDPDVAMLALERFRATPSLGFSDCLILETARKVGHLPLGTLDRRLGRLDGAQKL